METNETSKINPNFIDSLNHPLAQEIRNLLSNAHDTNQFIIEDEENILQALTGKVYINRIYTTDRNLISTTLMEKLPNSVPIIDVSKRTCKKLFAQTRQPHLFALAILPKLASLEPLTQFTRDIIVLDDLSITGNIGAIIRTANAFEVDAIIFLNATPAQVFDRRIIRASRGYIFRIPILTADQETLIPFCRDNNIALMVTAANGKDHIENITQLPKRLAMIFGSEKQGCHEELIAISDYQAKIPISDHVESLNVSVATSIFLYLRNVFWKKYNSDHV